MGNQERHTFVPLLNEMPPPRTSEQKRGQQCKWGLINRVLLVAVILLSLRLLQAQEAAPISLNSDPALVPRL